LRSPVPPGTATPSRTNPNTYPAPNTLPLLIVQVSPLAVMDSNSTIFFVIGLKAKLVRAPRSFACVTLAVQLVKFASKSTIRRRMPPCWKGWNSVIDRPLKLGTRARTSGEFPTSPWTCSVDPAPKRVVLVSRLNTRSEVLI
jgi:hypothetical protein